MFNDSVPFGLHEAGDFIRCPNPNRFNTKLINRLVEDFVGNKRNT
jgi:hypothetical protein